MIQINCPECRKALRASPAAAGKKLKCPGCGTIISVPAGEPAPSPVAALPKTATKTDPKPPPLPRVQDDEDEPFPLVRREDDGFTDERPLQKRRRDRDDDEDDDDRPRRRRSARDDDDDYDDDRRVRSRRSARDDDDYDDDRSRRRRRRSRDDDDDIIRRPRDNHTLEEFPVWAVILLHYATCGLFTMIKLMLMHGQMPQNRSDDPSAGKAIGFCFIPIFGPLYWQFFANARLCHRINEQRRLAGLPQDAPTGLAITSCVLMIIPYVNLLIGLPIVLPIYGAMVQAKVNELVREGRDRD